MAGIPPPADPVELTMHYPRRREVLRCDFTGMSEPEMIKDRPVVILSCSPARPGLAIVIPLSTTPPNPPQPWHHRLSRASQWDSFERWAKCDMLYALRIGRLSPWKLGRSRATGERKYLRDFFVSEEDFAAIQRGVLRALGMER